MKRLALTIALLTGDCDRVKVGPSAPPPAPVDRQQLMETLREASARVREAIDGARTNTKARTR